MTEVFKIANGAQSIGKLSSTFQTLSILSMTYKLESGTYILTNVSIALPIRPQYDAANSNIICQKHDYSDSYKVS